MKTGYYDELRDEYIEFESKDEQLEVALEIDPCLEKLMKNAAPITPWIKKLLPHEKSLYDKGLVFNVCR